MSLLHDRTRDRGTSALRSMACAYMCILGLSYGDIARLLGRDKSTIWSLARSGQLLLQDAHDWDINVVLDLVSDALFIPNGRGLDQGGNPQGYAYWYKLEDQARRQQAAFPPETKGHSQQKPNPLEDILGRVARFMESLQEAFPNQTQPVITVTVTIDSEWPGKD